MFKNVIASLQWAAFRQRLSVQPVYDLTRAWQPTEVATAAACGNGQLQGRHQSYKLLSYNILAQRRIQKHRGDYYAKCSEQALSWPTRLRNLRQELNVLSPDLLCLQEAQAEHLQPLIERLNSPFDGELKYIVSNEANADNDNGGCAIAYNSAKFELLECFAQTQYALCAKFRLRLEPHKSLCVASVHSCAALRLLWQTQQATMPLIVAGGLQMRTTMTPLKPLKLSNATTLTAWRTADQILHSYDDVHGDHAKIWSIYQPPKHRSPLPNSFFGSDHHCLGIVFTVMPFNSTPLNSKMNTTLPASTSTSASTSGAKILSAN